MGGNLMRWLTGEAPEPSPKLTTQQQAIVDEVFAAKLKVEGLTHLTQYAARRMVETDNILTDLTEGDNVQAKIVRELEVTQLRKIKQIQAGLFENNPWTE